jgi:triacylglycerol lipase
VRAILTTALWVVGVWILVVWVCALVYVVVSYVAGVRYVPRRGGWATARAMLREMGLAMWTQPLMPLFQAVLGVRLGSGGGRVPVVLVHGYFQNRVDFLYLARRLRRAGSGPLFAVNFFWPQRLERSSATVERFVDWVRAETGAERVDLLTHSTGGLLGFDLMEHRPDVVRHAAMVALPGRGVPWRGPLIGTAGNQLRVGSFYRGDREPVADTVPVLSVYSAHDNVVHPASTSRVEGPCATNVEVEGPGHLAVLFDRRVADEVIRFLLAEQPADTSPDTSTEEPADEH